METELAYIYLGEVEYSEGRRLQERLVAERLSGQRADTVVFCEHPPTLTLGKRIKDEALPGSDEFWSKLGIKVVRTDRGGATTYHGPGQLIMYPVVSIRERAIGVKDFVHCGLNAVSRALKREFGVQAEVRKDLIGVWVRESDGKHAKVGAVGLKISHGITNHGFSVNLSGNTDVYGYFDPCGVAGMKVTTVAALTQLGAKELSPEGFSINLWRCFCDEISEHKRIEWG